MRSRRLTLTRRVDLNVGYSCNMRCRFCYYQQTLHNLPGGKFKVKDLSTARCKYWLALARRNGMERIDLTGGEPTIRGDLLELAAHARRIGFQSVCLITNGLRLAQKDYVSRLVDAGVDDFLLSIHGPTRQPHDLVTGVEGAFDRVIRAVGHIKEHPVKLRVNCVITQINHGLPLETVELFDGLGIETVNFILFNPIEEAGWASDPALNVAYSEAAPHLKRAIDRFAAPGRKITVRYIPFCLMRGYEPFVTNMPQIQYDHDEWDYLLRMRMRRGDLRSGLGLVLGIAVHPAKLGALRRGGIRTLTREGMKRFLQLKNKRFGSACRSCALRTICDGLWSRYVRWRGFDELETVHGARITDPTHFMQMNPQFDLD